MKPGEASLLRLYMNADDHFHGKPLYECGGREGPGDGPGRGSVFPAELGYGLHRVVHDAMSEYSFIGAPLVIEVVDSEERIKDLLTEFKAMVGEGLVTVSTVSPVEVARDVHPSE